jgi:putative transposase
VRSAKQECLERFVAFGEGNLRLLVSEYADYYNRQRPHQAVGNKPLSGAPPGGSGEVVCEERLGGLLRHYRRAA